MTKRELIKRLKIQVSTMKKDGLDKYPEVLCSRADMLIITCADNPFRAAEVFIMTRIFPHCLEIPTGSL